MINSARDNTNFDFIEFVYPKNVEQIIFLAPLMPEIEMVSIVVKHSWPTKVNSARDKVNFDPTEIVYPMIVGNQWKINFLGFMLQFFL